MRLVVLIEYRISAEGATRGTGVSHNLCSRRDEPRGAGIPVYFVEEC